MKTKPYIREGAKFRQVINDLKRRPEDAAADLGVSSDHIASILDGRCKLSPNLVDRAVEIWPVNPSDFNVIYDDAPSGVKIMRASESASSERVMERAGKDYYAYRDTVMSKVAMFRPEWIQELCVVRNNDPENPEVQWNNGHFMHQFTYFIGPVNFYYRDSKGRKAVAVMNTGDSMYITPFVPHTFTTRQNEAGEKGLILALTYGDKVAGDAQQELSALGPDLGSKLAMDFSTRERACGALVNLFARSISMSLQELARLSGVKGLSEIVEGLRMPKYEELESLADVLGVNLRELLPPLVEPKVALCPYAEARRWDFPQDGGAYKMVELANTRDLPYSKGLEVTVIEDSNEVLDIDVGLHQFGYNVGDTPLTLIWQDGRETIMSGDSFYLKPHVRHAFRGAGARILVMRIGGRIAGEPLMELSRLDEAGVARAIQETSQWFSNARAESKPST